ncbi:MAG: O-antigen ligase family protein [Deltaproteobacteria bacterium]
MVSRAVATLPRARVVGEILLAAALFVAPLSLGGYPPVAVALLVALTGAALLSIGLSRPRSAGLPAPLAGLGLAAMAAFVGLQLVPLPPWLLRWLSPGAAETWAVALAGLGLPGPRPATLDLPATALGLGKALALALAFFTATSLAQSSRARRRLTATLAAGGLVLALIGYLHKLVGTDRLFGLWAFQEANPPFLTPFGNPNNAGGYLCLCAPLALGFALRSKDRRRQALWGIAFLLEGAGVFLTLSRGGILAFTAGSFALILLLRSERARERGGPRPSARPRRRVALAAGLGALGAMAVAGYLALDPIEHELSTLAPGDVLQEGKLEGFGRALELVPHFPWMGVGSGAFATVGSRVMGFSGGTAEYVENAPIELVVDLGVPMALALLLALAATFLRGFSREPLSALDCALAAGLFSLGIQSLADFSLELLGVSLPAAVALALFAAEPETARRASPRLAAALAGLALVVGVPAALYGGHGWKRETDDFVRRAGSLSATRALELARPLQDRHPASFVVPLALADRYLAEGKPAHALDWLNRALFLRPDLPAAHLVAEGALVELGRRDQALLEARLFAEATPESDLGLAALAPLRPTVPELERALPDTAAARLVLGRFLLGRGLRAAAAAEATQAAGLAAGDGATLAQCSSIALSAGQAELAATLAREAIQAAPKRAESYLSLASALSADPASVRSTLALALDRIPSEPSLWLALAQLDLSQGKLTAAEADLRRVGPVEGAGARAGLLDRWGDVYAAEGRDAKAEEAYESASRIEPHAGHEWRLVALCEQRSRFAEAARLLARLEPLADAAERKNLSARRRDDERRQRDLEAAEERDRLLGPDPPTPAP